MQNFNILVCLNHDIFYPLTVLLQSLFENTKNDEHINLFVLQTDFTEDDNQTLYKFVKNNGHDVTIIHADKNHFSSFDPSGRITIEAYLRLACVDYLPKNLERILYVDVDVIIDKNISSLYNQDFEDAFICAMPVPTRTFSYNDWLKFSDKATITFINTGVILINLAKWREYGYNLTRFAEIYNKIYKQLGHKPPVQDQSVINVAFADKVKLLDQRQYNHRAAQKIDWERMDSDNKYATIIHYTNDLGAVKPWHYYFTDDEKRYYALRYDEIVNSEIHYMHRKWWRYAEHTPFYMLLQPQARIRALEYLDLVPKLKENIAFKKANNQLNIENKRWQSYSNFYEQLYKKNITSEKLEKWLISNHFINIALYCYMKPAKTFIDLITKSKIVKIIYIAENGQNDTNYKFISKDSSIFPTADVMFICNFEYMEEIKSKLSQKINFPFYSIDKILEIGNDGN